ncbi:MAG: helix-turn-helix domain-containing protein [Planctomycetaceae bacterium]
MKSETKSTVKTQGEPSPPTYSAPAIDKALDVLELLADSAQGMSLTGIAEALGRTKQELFSVGLPGGAGVSSATRCRFIDSPPRCSRWVRSMLRRKPSSHGPCHIWNVCRLSLESRAI